MNIQPTEGAILRRPHDIVSPEVQSGIETCLNCHRACEQLIPHCLEKGGAHASEENIGLLLSCADICRTCAHLMMWNSDQQAPLCVICARVCIRCAETSERISDDLRMKACADVCRRCAAHCERLSLRH